MNIKKFGLSKIALILAAVIVLGLLVGCGGPPTAVFQSSVASGQAPLSVTFTNQSKNAGEFTWDFGDGKTDTSASVKDKVNHTYEKAGTLTVTLTATNKAKPPETNTTTAIITVSPAELDSVVFVPAEISFTAKETRTVKVEARDRFNNVIPDVQLTFTADVKAGQIDNSGTFTAVTTAGSYQDAVSVKAVQGSITKSAAAKVIVTAGPLDNVVINPATADVVVGKTQEFTVAAFDAYKNPVSGDIKIAYKADGKAGQTDSSGVFTAGTKAGVYENAVTVEVTQGNNTKSAAAKVTVAAGPLDHVVINPTAAEVTAGKNQAFTAAALDAYENPVSADTKIAFKTDTKAGKIDNSGLFTAGTKAGVYEGAVTAEATQGDIAKSAKVNVTITAGPLDHVLISPATVALNIGQTQKFDATAVDGYDNPVSGAQIAWNAETEVGTLTGSSLTTGTIAKTFAKGITATAKLGDLSGTGSASVTVKPDPLDTVSLPPNEATAGTTYQLKLDAKDKYGNQVTDIQTVWTVLDENIGSVSGTGELTTGLVALTFPNAVQVKVTQGDIVKTVTGTVTIIPGPLAQVVVGPSQIDLGMGMTQQFVAVGADQYGNRITGLAFSWSVTAGGGTVDGKGLFTASVTPGTYNKTVKAEATQGSITRSATASVIVQQDHISYISIINDYIHLNIMDIDGKNVTQIEGVSSYLDDFSMNWAPDGRRLAVVGFDTSTYLDQIIVLDNQGNWAYLIPEDMDCYSPAWSPNGSKIAFTGVIDGHLEIFVANVDGSSLTRLTDNAYLDDYPAWSPDGTKIAFFSERDGRAQIYVMNSDGTGQTRIRASSSIDVIPSWSPDGKQIVFQTRVSGGRWTIATMNADGTNFQQLTPDSYSSNYPSWSPDGKKIVFHSFKDGTNPGIYIMDTDGQNITRLSSMTVEDYAPKWEPRVKGVTVSEDSIIIPGAKSLRALTTEQIVSQSSKAVVRIETDLGSGSGFIIDSNGLIMTANHVISGAKEISVYLEDGTKYIATVKGRDMVRDIALIKISASGLPFLKLGDLSRTSLGQAVIVLGYPLGSKEISVTTGIVSSIKTDNSRNVIWVQTDSAINPGNSGGPMLNAQGEVIGVVNSKAVGYGVEGVGYAVSVNTVDIYLARLQEGQTIY